VNLYIPTRAVQPAKDETRRDHAPQLQDAMMQLHATDGISLVACILPVHAGWRSCPVLSGPGAVWIESSPPPPCRQCPSTSCCSSGNWECGCGYTWSSAKNRRYKYARGPLMCFLLSVWLGIQYSLPLSVCMHACLWAIMAHANQLGWAQISQLHIPIFILSSLQLRQNHLPYDIEFL